MRSELHTTIEADEESAAPVVLVVEDQEPVRQLVRTVLEAHGYRVLEAGDGGEALAHLERSPDEIDLVLTDVVMPDINGAELVARLDSRGCEARVLFMSGHGDSTLLRRGLNDGSVQVLHKPFTIAQLTERVAELVGPADVHE